jgi:hypothetical protein
MTTTEIKAQSDRGRGVSRPVLCAVRASMFHFLPGKLEAEHLDIGNGQHWTLGCPIS